MDELQIRKDLCVLISHYIRQRNPNVYARLQEYCISNQLLPNGCNSLDEALDVKYRNFHPDQFLTFLKTLAPSDDYPSLFRRLTPFPEISDNQNCVLRLIDCKQVHSKAIYCIAFDPLSRYFVTGSDDSTIKLLRLPFIQEICTFQHNSSVVVSVSIDCTSSILLSSSHDGSIILWSLNDGQMLCNVDYLSQSPVYYSNFSPDGKYLSVTYGDGTLYIIKIEDLMQSKNTYIKIISPEGNPIDWVSFSPGSEFIGYTSDPNHVILYSISTSKKYELRYHTGSVMYVTFSKRLYPSPHGMAPKVLTYSVEDGSMVIWKLEQNGFIPANIFKSPSRKTCPIVEIVWDNDDHLAIIVRKTNIIIYDTVIGKIISQLPDEKSITEGVELVAIHPKINNIVVFSTNRNVFSVWDFYEPKLLTTWVHKQSNVELVEIQWSKCGKYIIASDVMGNIILLNFSIGECITKICKLSSPIFDKDSSMNFQIDVDLSYNERCNELEEHLAHSLLDINTVNPMIQQPENIIVPQPPEHIQLQYVRPLNPFNIEDEDFDFPKEETLENLQTIEETSNDTIILFNDNNNQFIECNLNHFNIYEPFNKYNRPPWVISLLSKVYIPEVGDDVIYLHSLNSDIPQSLSGITFPEITRAKILRLEPINLGFLVTLNVSQNTNFSFQITYSYDSECDCLFPLSSFNTYLGLLEDLSRGQKVEFELNSKCCYGEVISVNQNYLRSIYQSITIMTNNSRVIKISPWDLLSIDGINIGSIVKPSSNNGWLQTLYPIFTKEKYNEFNDISNFDTSFIIQPMDLNFISERLKSGWYRSTISLQNDFELFLLNVKALSNFLDVNKSIELYNEVAEILHFSSFK